MACELIFFFSFFFIVEFCDLVFLLEIFYEILCIVYTPICILCRKRRVFEGKVNIDYFMHFAVLRRKSRKKFNCM